MGRLRTTFNNLPIRRKLILIISLTIWLAMLMAVAAFIMYDQRTAKQNLVSETAVLAKVIADRSGAALAFRDTKAAQGNLQSLAFHPAVQSACLLHKHNLHALAVLELAATQQAAMPENKAPPQTCPIQHALLPDQLPAQIKTWFTANSLQVAAPVVVKGKQYGVLLLQMSLAPIQDRFWQFSLVALVIQAIAGVIAYGLTIGMQRFIVNPLQHLSAVARDISNTRNYSLRAQQESKDEVGDVVTAFNAMLHTIQQAQHQLQEANYELEEKRAASEAYAKSTETRRKELSDYFAGASHDLRQPLNAMGLYLQELRDALNNALNTTPEKDHSRRLLDNIQRSNENLETLLTELLDVSKLEEGLKKPKLQSVDLLAILEKITQDMAVLAQDKHLDFRMRCPEITVHSDPLMLERMIRNLVSNAIRYTEQGGILLAARSVPGTQQVSIEIWDTGIGIPQQKQSDIFSAHVQLGNQEQAPDNGFGLGLSIVKRLATLLNHPISVHSKVASGTVFKIQATQAELQHHAMPTNRQTSVAVADHKGQGETILLVDDDVAVTQSLARLLQNWGYTVASATTYQQAIAHLANNPDIDLLITDYNLQSTQTGLDLIQQAKEQGVQRSLLITAEKDPTLWQALQQQQVPALAKPIRPAKLRASIQYLQNTEAHD